MPGGIGDNPIRAMTKDITAILNNWPEGGENAARRIVAEDGTELLQLKIDLGILQMYLDGRPDGERPFGRPSLLDHLSRVTTSRPDTAVDPEMWGELDREVMQYYHRRRALLVLGARSQVDGEAQRAAEYFQRAVQDADHNLRIMDFIKAHSSDKEFIEGHERYRPFVLMHRALAEAQTKLIREDADEAVECLKAGVGSIEEVYRTSEATELARQDPSILQLRALEKQIRREHSIVQTLQEQLQTAIENEEFERAAALRDRLSAKRALRRTAEDA